VRIVGLVANDTSDTLVLRMLGQLLAPSGCSLEIIADADSSLEAAERVAEHSPALVVVSHLPPAGLTLARYLVRRVRTQFAELPIVVGHWGETTGAAAAAEQLIRNGASRVVFTLADARAHILAQVVPEPKNAALASAPTG
jgi:methylmalonyl-CoA mutase cobalamin-binding subunit